MSNVSRGLRRKAGGTRRAYVYERDRFIYNTGTGQLTFDSNGSLTGGAHVIATLDAVIEKGVEEAGEKRETIVLQFRLRGTGMGADDGRHNLAQHDGLRRVAEIKAGTAAWPQLKGRVNRAYRSAVDGTAHVQAAVRALQSRR